MNVVLLPFQIEKRHAGDLLGNPENPQVVVDRLGHRRPVVCLQQTVMRPAMERPTLGRIAHRSGQWAAIGDASTALALAMPMPLAFRNPVSLFAEPAFFRCVAHATSRWYLFSRVLANAEGDIRKSRSARKTGRPGVGWDFPVRKSESAQMAKNSRQQASPLAVLS